MSLNVTSFASVFQDLDERSWAQSWRNVLEADDILYLILGSSCPSALPFAPAQNLSFILITGPCWKNLHNISFSLCHAKPVNSFFVVCSLLGWPYSLFWWTIPDPGILSCRCLHGPNLQIPQHLQSRVREARASRKRSSVICGAATPAPKSFRPWMGTFNRH